MSKKKNKKGECDCSEQTFNKIIHLGSLSNVKVIPIREIPDNCQLICVGPVCYLACFAESNLRVIHCDIVCDDAGNCKVICTPDENV